MQKTCEFMLTAAVHSLHKEDLPAGGQNQGPVLHPRRILSTQEGSQVLLCISRGWHCSTGQHNSQNLYRT